MFGIAIELRGECPHCGRPVMVNALTDRIHCPSCLKDRPYPYGEWADLLESAWNLGPNDDPGQGGTTTVLGANWHLLYARFDPYCYKCKYDFDMDLVRATDGPYACPKCGARWHHRPMPDDAKAALPGVRWLVAEDPRQIPEGRAEAPAPGGAKPILFQCMGCGGSLEVDGSERVVTCKFCDASNFLPDELWLRMHPVDTVRRWFLWCDKGALLRGDEAEDEEEDDSDAFFSDVDDQIAETGRLIAELQAEDEITEAELTLEAGRDGLHGEPYLQPDRVEGPRASSPRSTKERKSDLLFWTVVAAAVMVVLGCGAIWAWIILQPH